MDKYPSATTGPMREALLYLGEPARLRLLADERTTQMRAQLADLCADRDALRERKYFGPSDLVLLDKTLERLASQIDDLATRICEIEEVEAQKENGRRESELETL